MKRISLAALVLCASCGSGVSPPPTASMPWVHGFHAVAVGDIPTAPAAQRMSELLSAGGVDDHGGIELRADLAGDSDLETLLVSYRLGLVVADRAGRLVARAPGLDETGSADDLISVAVGQGWLGVPMILVATQTGGHRESTISLAIYRLRGLALEQVFSAPIEEHDGSDTVIGSLTFVPSGLLYRAPRARLAAKWTFDAQQRRYIERGIPAPEPARPSI